MSQATKTSAQATTWDTQSTLSSADTICSTTLSANVKGTEGSDKTSMTKKAWNAIKKHAKEHHASVNAAYSLYYGAPAQQRTTVWKAYLHNERDGWEDGGDQLQTVEDDKYQI